MSAPRRFDWDEARRLRSAGVPVREIAGRMGVTTNAIYLATNDQRRAKQNAYVRTWQLDHRVPCIDGCGTLVYKPAGTRKGRCLACAARASATSVRNDALHCASCQEWKPDRAFPHHRGEKHRRNRHATCRACHTKIKRAYRERLRVPCSHGCGRMVDTVDRRYPDRPPQCRSCFHAARRKPRAVPREAVSPTRRAES